MRWDLVVIGIGYPVVIWLLWVVVRVGASAEGQGRKPQTLDDLKARRAEWLKALRSDTSGVNSKRVS